LVWMVGLISLKPEAHHPLKDPSSDV